MAPENRADDTAGMTKTTPLATLGYAENFNITSHGTRAYELVETSQGALLGRHPGNNRQWPGLVRAHSRGAAALKKACVMGFWPGKKPCPCLDSCDCGRSRCGQVLDLRRSFSTFHDNNSSATAFAETATESQKQSDMGNLRRTRKRKPHSSQQRKPHTPSRACSTKSGKETNPGRRCRVAGVREKARHLQLPRPPPPQ